MIPELYDFSNNSDYCRLFETVFRKPMGKTESERHFQWEYLENPAGKAIVYIVKSPPDQIAGAYAALPLRMKMFSKTVKGCLSFDSMTHPQHKVKGLFTRLGKAHYEYLAENNYDLIYGFPNANSIKIFVNNLQWLDFYSFPLLVKIQDFRSLFKKYLGLKHPSRVLGFLLNKTSDLIFSPKHMAGVNVREISNFDEKFNYFWDDVKQLFPICVERDMEYLNWRYRRPEEKYRILRLEHEACVMGYAVLKEEDRFGLRTGYIMDLISVPDIKFVRLLISEVINAFSRARVDLISILMSKSTPYYSSLRRYGFMPIPSRFHPQEIHFGARINTIQDRAEDIRNGRNWFISWGDTDLL